MIKDGRAEKADELSQSLRSQGLSVTSDQAGSIGKRYRRQDEIGTPWCLTVDYQTLEDNTVTLRNRDTMEQVGEGGRVSIRDLGAYIL
jgi:glycyl-tRNA synthetase